MPKAVTPQQEQLLWNAIEGKRQSEERAGNTKWLVRLLLMDKDEQDAEIARLVGKMVEEHDRQLAAADAERDEKVRGLTAGKVELDKLHTHMKPAKAAKP